MTTNNTDGTTASTDARVRLLDAARQAFAEKGYSGTTTRDIASRAGMSPAAVYVHHRTKEDLLFEISLSGHKAALEVINSAAAAHEVPLDQIAAMVREFSRWHAIYSRTGRIVQYEFGSLTPEHRAEIAGYRRGIEERVRESLAAGVADGTLDVADIPGTALALLSLSIDLVRWYEPGGKIAPDEIANLHAALATKMIAMQGA
ncbi:MAG: TetR/AcrR family transcriptional regulator [Actinomycetales bacterium]|nr:TetR/AcrR family transcriptional regulator [Actinomycetales bacterium]